MIEVGHTVPQGGPTSSGEAICVGSNGELGDGAPEI